MAFSLAFDPDPFPELAIERGRYQEGVGSWVPGVKHTFLAKQIEATRQARKKFPQSVFIDLFCGPGRIQVKGETMTRHGGSLNTWQHTLLADAAFTRCLVGDLDETRSTTNTQQQQTNNTPKQTNKGPAED